MQKVRHRPGFLTIALSAALLLPAVGYAQLTRGGVSGTVDDETGGVLPGATVTITSEDTGQVRTTSTSSDGIYRAAALEPGLYTVRVQLDGFQSIEHQKVAIHTSEEVTLDVTLRLIALAETVTVQGTTAGATLNKVNPTVGVTMGTRHLTELPLSADRDPARLALLAPNVFSAPGASPLSANGQRSRNNNFTIDGSDNNEMTTTTATMRLVPEAVAEFQVQTNPYNVEFGRNTGAQINVITRSGTNAVRGELFEFYRGSALSSLNNIEKANGLDRPARFNRNQFGVAAGGPVVKNRLFFYGLMQNDRTRAASTFGATVRMPTPAGLAALASAPLGAGQTAASRLAVLDQLDFLRDIHAQAPAFRSIQNALVNGAEVETGQTNIGRATPSNLANVLVRVDSPLSDTDSFTFRYVTNRTVNASVYSNVDLGDRFAADEDVKDTNTAVSYTRILSPNLLNEARLSHIRRDLAFPEADPDSPTASIGGFFTIGGTNQFPQGRVQNSFQFSDVLTHHRGRHALKLGSDLRYITLDNLSAMDSKGTFTFNNLQDYMNNRATLYRQALQTASFDASQWQLFFFLQDDVKVTPSLTMNLGVRYENSTVPLGFFGATEPHVQASRVPGPLGRDNDNVAPRVGFAWSPSGRHGLLNTLFDDGRGVLRGGYGLAYDVLFYNLLVLAASNYPRVVVGDLNNAVDVYPNTTPVSGTAVFSPLATFRNVPGDGESPMSHFWSASFQRDLADRLTMEMGYTGSLGRNGLTQMQGNPAVLTPEQAATVQQTMNSLAIPSVQARRESPDMGSRILYATVGRSEYHAAFMRVDHRFRHGLQVGAAYTWSKLMSDSDELLALPDIAMASPQVPQDYNALDREWSVSAFDRTHRVAASWIYELPRVDGRTRNALLGGWRFAGVFQAQSGQPFTILTGVDSNGNGAGGDRPNVNPAGRLTSDPVTGNFRSFTTEGMFFVPRGTNGAPLAFSLGNGNLGRNTLRAPAVFNWDFSVARAFRLFRSHTFTLRADVFNAFNQDNYGIPVNAMNDLSFGQNVNNWGNRSMTVSVKYAF
jgi:hypothetical protein